MQGSVTIRLVPPPPQTIREGKVTRTVPGVPFERLEAVLRPLVEPEVRALLGDNVIVHFEEARQPDIRLHGKFGKPGDVKREIGEILGSAFDALDVDALSS